MINSTYAPKKVSDFEANKLNFNGIGLSLVCTAAAESTLDHIIADDHLITGGRIVLQNATYGDYFNIEVVDVMNVMGYGAGLVLNRFFTNYKVPEGNNSFAIESLYPAKLYAGLYLRIRYVNTGIVDSKFSINYFLHKVLI